jgi:hypothetical protein
VKVVRLETGAEMRVTVGARAVVCVNGGQAAEVEGTWSASLEWLVRRLAPALPPARLRRGALSREVVAATRLVCRRRACGVRAVAAQRTLLLGFSTGGAVAISAADEASVERVLGLAPWIPDRLSLEPLRRKRLDVLHGSLDRWLPGVRGVCPASSRRGFERARSASRAGTS